MVYTLFFFSWKCSLFHNSNIFGSCIIHILCTGCAKIKKNNSGAKRLNVTTRPCCGQSIVWSGWLPENSSYRHVRICLARWQWMSQRFEGWTEPWSGSHLVCNGSIIDWTYIVLPIFAFIILICSAFQMCMHRTYTRAGKWNVQCAIQFQASGMITKITVLIMVGRKQMWYIKQGK